MDCGVEVNRGPFGQIAHKQKPFIEGGMITLQRYNAKTGIRLAISTKLRVRSEVGVEHHGERSERIGHLVILHFQQLFVHEYLPYPAA